MLDFSVKPEQYTQYQWCFCWFVVGFHIQDQDLSISSFYPLFFGPLANSTLDWQLELESRELAGAIITSQRRGVPSKTANTQK